MAAEAIASESRPPHKERVNGMKSINAREEAADLVAAGCRYLTAKELAERYGYTEEEAKAVRKEMSFLEWLGKNS